MITAKNKRVFVTRLKKTIQFLVYVLVLFAGLLIAKISKNRIVQN